MVKRIFICIIVSILLSNLVIADALADFENDPTADNFAKLSNPGMGQFNQLPSNEKKIYLKSNFGSQNQNYLKFSDDYLKRLDSINANLDNALIANDYFSKITGIQKVDLTQGSMEWNGVNLRNGKFILDIESLKSVPNIASMISTADKIILKYAKGTEISLGGSNPNHAFKLKQGNQILVNNQEYNIQPGSNIEIVFKNGDATITNKGGSQIKLGVNEDIDVLSFFEAKDLTVTTKLESIELEPDGSVAIDRTFLPGELNKQQQAPKFVLTNGKLTFEFERNLPSGEFYALREVVESNNKPTTIETVKITDTKFVLKKNQNQRSVYLFHPSTWGGVEEVQGVVGKNLEDAFRKRSGFVAVGGGFSIATAELNKQGKITRGFVYNPSMPDEDHQGELYLRYGIEPETLVTDANDNKIETYNLPFNVIFPDGTEQDISKLSTDQLFEVMKTANHQFIPFSTELTQFTVVDPDESKPLSERINYRHSTNRADVKGPELYIAEKTRALGESSASFKEGVLDFDDYAMQYRFQNPEDYRKSIEEERDEALRTFGLSASIGDAYEIRDGRLYQGKKIADISYQTTALGEEKTNLKINGLTLPNPRYGGDSLIKVNGDIFWRQKDGVISGEGANVQITGEKGERITCANCRFNSDKGKTVLDVSEASVEIEGNKFKIPKSTITFPTEGSTEINIKNLKYLTESNEVKEITVGAADIKVSKAGQVTFKTPVDGTILVKETTTEEIFHYTIPPGTIYKPGEETNSPIIFKTESNDILNGNIFIAPGQETLIPQKVSVSVDTPSHLIAEKFITELGPLGFPLKIFGVTGSGFQKLGEPLIGASKFLSETLPGGIGHVVGAPARFSGELLGFVGTILTGGNVPIKIKKFDYQAKGQDK
jgi:hypothetical protein